MASASEVASAIGTRCSADACPVTRMSYPAVSSKSRNDTSMPRDSSSMLKSSAPMTATPVMASTARAGLLTTVRHARPHAVMALPADQRDDVAAQERPRSDEAGDDAERHGERHRFEGDAPRDAHEDERGVVAPLEEAIDRALGREREQHTEDRAGGGDQQSFDEDLEQDRSLRDPDQPDDPDRLAPLLRAHDHQREQKRGAAEHGHDGDGEMEAIEYGERIGAVLGAGGGAGGDPGRARHEGGAK